MNKTPKYLESDESCVRRACQDEASAYQTLYDRYKHRIFQYIRIRIDNSEDARDLTASTFHKAFAKIKKLRQPHHFRAWLFKIAQNECKMYFRSRATKIPTTTVGDISELSLATNKADNPIADSVRWTLNQLSPAEQDMLIYRLIEKKTIDEIAEMTGKKADAVRYLLKKARKKFTAIYLSKYKLRPDKKEGDSDEKV